jgi:Uma2 family endonuclease
MTARSPDDRPGPYTADQIAEGEPYELSNGHLIRCEPGGGSHGIEKATGALVLGSDPAANDVGVDTGFSWTPKMLRAPDLAVGNIPNQPGWVKGVPHLAVEYADVGQDEQELEQKIRDLLDAGTRYLWVVRLTGPRRVEVFEPGKPMRVVLPGDTLIAPGVLKNPVRVEALYDRDVAERATLTNLLQRQGYEGLDAARAAGRAEGKAEGKAEGLRAAVRSLCRALSVPLTEKRDAEIQRMNAAELDALREHLERERRWK